MTNSTTALLTLCLLSDTTLGRGDGVAGVVDAEVQHDEYGLPYLSGKTLKGLLAAECAELLFALDQQNDPELREWIKAADDLFGRAGSRHTETGKLHVGDARLTANLRAALATEFKEIEDKHPDFKERVRQFGLHQRANLEAFTAVRRQTAMDHTTGAPQDNSLRAMRVILRDTCLEAELRYPTPLKDNDKRRTLLQDCAKALRRLGTGRNRGRGKVTTTFAWRETPPPTASLRPSPEDRSVLQFELHLREPVLATQTASGEPNSATSLNYLPGSMIRGALIAAQANGALDLNDEAIYRRFLSGQVRFLNAYPLVDEKVFWPAPRAWFKDKVGADIYNALEALSPDKNVKRFDKPFAVVSTPEVLTYAPREVNIVHNASTERDYKSVGVSQVFRYQAIAAGEVFQATIIGPAADLNVLRQQLPETLWLGGARTGGYGMVQVVVNEEIRPYAPVTKSDGDLTVIMLLSDTILRKANGEFAQNLDEFVGEAAPPLNPPALKAFVTIQTVGGFNRKWGLPMPQAWAMAAGSVLVYEKLSDQARQRLNEAARAGLGERVAEGFGQIVLDPPKAASSFIPQERYRSVVIETGTPSKVDGAQAERVRERRLRVVLEAKLIAAVTEAKITYAPRPSQLARARVATHQALYAPELERLKDLQDFLEALSEKREKAASQTRADRPAHQTRRLKAGGQQFERAFINLPAQQQGAPRLLAWLTDQAALPVGLLEKNLELTEADLPKFNGQRATLTPTLRREFTARLIEGVLKRALRHAQRVALVEGEAV